MQEEKIRARTQVLVYITMISVYSCVLPLAVWLFIEHLSFINNPWLVDSRPASIIGASTLGAFVLILVLCFLVMIRELQFGLERYNKAPQDDADVPIP